MSLQIDLSKMLFAAEPGLLQNDLASSARAASEVSNLLGCIMATVLVKQPDNYEAAMKALLFRIHESAIATAGKAATIIPNITSH